MKKALIILAILVGFFGLVFMVLLGGLVYIGVKGPETHVVPGNTLNNSFVKTMRDMDLLEAGETIHFFYSDALTDITEGMYVLTDRKLLLHSSLWEEPTHQIGFSEIDTVDLERDESFFLDSTVLLTLKDGSILDFPLSSEMDRDVVFSDKLKQMAGLQ